MAVIRTKAQLPAAQKTASVKAGVLASARYPDGTPVGLVAIAHEFGTSTLPPRPFMRQTRTRDGTSWAAAFRKLLLAGRDPVEALEIVGLLMKESIQGTIQAWPADNSDAWAARKGFNHGLVHTGFLAQSIDYQLED